MLVDLLQPVAMTTIDVRWPTDDRARQVADRLAASPADSRTLAEWGHEVGASERTLARAFVAETGVSFGRWRTLIRIQAALTALAGGEPVGNVARRVGYDSDSAFVQAFRRETGVTPASYFRSASYFAEAGVARLRQAAPALWLAQQPQGAFLLEVERAGRGRLDPADAPAELGDFGPHPRVGEYADAEGKGHRADVIAPLDRHGRARRRPGRRR